MRNVKVDKIAVYFTATCLPTVGGPMNTMIAFEKKHSKDILPINVYSPNGLNNKNLAYHLALLDVMSYILFTDWPNESIFHIYTDAEWLVDSMYSQEFIKTRSASYGTAITIKKIWQLIKKNKHAVLFHSKPYGDVMNHLTVQAKAV